MLPFLSAMLALLILGLAIDARWLAGTAFVLLTNWAAEVAMVQYSGDQFPWLFFMVADYLSALAILLMRENRWQSTVAAIYAAQMVCHAGFGLSDQGEIAQYEYWWTLTYSGWAQLAAIGGGGVYALYRRFGGAGSGVSHPVAMLARRKGSKK